jgi:CBS domain-containing protein
MIRDLMNRSVVTCESSAKVFDASRLMKLKDVGCVVVQENNHPVGILTDRDIVVRCMATGEDPRTTTVYSIYTKNPSLCKETDGLSECIQKMKAAKVRRLPVVDSSGKLSGIISFGDIVSVLGQELHELSDRSHWTKASHPKKSA